jgi:hypothetical protein
MIRNFRLARWWMVAASIAAGELLVVPAFSAAEPDVAARSSAMRKIGNSPAETVPVDDILLDATLCDDVADRRRSAHEAAIRAADAELRRLIRSQRPAPRPIGWRFLRPPSVPRIRTTDWI